MSTKDYRTKTIFRDMDNLKLNNETWPIGIDIGYSGVKVFSGNTALSFPSYAAEAEGDTQISIGSDEDDATTIQYKGEDGVTWNVGAIAQNNISVSDTSAGSLAIYGRSRYYSPMFKILMRVGLAAGLIPNKYGDPSGKKIVIQTGLPPKYILSDKGDLKEVFMGRHVFSVRFGSNGWRDFDITIGEENFRPVMDQPEGTLFSIMTDRFGQLMSDAREISSSRVLIMDPGFGTLDLFPMVRRNINRDACQTFPELGMKRVLKDTAAEIFEKYNFEISVPAMQQFLETGQVMRREGRSYKKAGFEDILIKHSKDVCRKALDRIVDIYNPLVEFDCLVVTGGTGAAWYGYINEDERFATSDTVRIIPGNQGDTELPYIFSNVRGYYIFALSACRRM